MTPDNNTSAVPVTLRNHHIHLDCDDECIAVDSGAGDGFGNVATPGTNWQPADPDVAMVSAAGDLRKSVATDHFDLPLPAKARECHVVERGAVQRPLLCVGKACNAGCKVQFDKQKCAFAQHGEMLMKACRNP